MEHKIDAWSMLGDCWRVVSKVQRAYLASIAVAPTRGLTLQEATATVANYARCTSETTHQQSHSMLYTSTEI